MPPRHVDKAKTEGARPPKKYQVSQAFNTGIIGVDKVDVYGGGAHRDHQAPQKCQEGTRARDAIRSGKASNLAFVEPTTKPDVQSVENDISKNDQFQVMKRDEPEDWLGSGLGGNGKKGKGKKK